MQTLVNKIFTYERYEENSYYLTFYNVELIKNFGVFKKGEKYNRIVVNYDTGEMACGALDFPYKRQDFLLVPNKYRMDYLKQLYWKITKWFSIDWWKYILFPWKGFRTVICRAGGHKCGVIYYNPCGLEPDMHCKNCDDDLG